jgi:aryl-alcohol dehydrogenase-like predicted oxidoreductase
MKIILGTVQFGLNYGINNKEGKPDIQKVFGILDEARVQGIDTLDSADGYGDSADVIGLYQQKTGFKFKIISKFCLDQPNESIYPHLEKSLKRFQLSSFHCYFFHRFNDFKSYTKFKEVVDLKKQGLIKNLGVSLYSNQELEQVINHPDIDFIQLPFNVFDSSLEKQKLLYAAHKNGKEIHVRSVFLQGLFYKKPVELQGNQVEFTDNLTELNVIQKESGLSMEELSLSYVNHFDFINHVVIGVDNKDQLKKNISPEALLKLQNIKIKNQELLDPSKWK